LTIVISFDQKLTVVTAKGKCIFLYNKFFSYRAESSHECTQTQLLSAFNSILQRDKFVNFF